MPMVDANDREQNPTGSGARDTLVLGVIVIALLGVTGISLSAGPTWQAGGPMRAPWCLPGQSPRFEFGFAELARHLVDVMGEPTECEHGDEWTNDTRQATTTGVAVYRWCTNTPSFTRGHEQWILTPSGVEYLADGGPPPPPPRPLVHVPSLRKPCSP